MFNKFLKTLPAFTLAEVLITLGIIGVIASITIPTLINNYNKQQYVTNLKKFYTTMNQALTKISVDNGSTGDLAGTGLFGLDKTTEDLGDELAKQFKLSKNCKTTETDCATLGWSNYETGESEDYHTYYAQNSSAQPFYSFVTLDGMTIAIGQAHEEHNLGTPDCKSGIFSGGIIIDNICAVVYVDVNGKKEPNRFGRDIFNFYVTASGFLKNYPISGDFYCNPDTTNKQGGDCAKIIIEKGWQMNY